MSAEPRFATKRDPTRDTLGPEVIKIMRLLGWDPMPWQEMVADVAYEIDDNGELVYSEIIEEVPRQAGKTSLTLASQVHRATEMHRRIGKPQSSLYFAQKGQDARNKLVEEHIPILDASPFKPLYRPILRNGNEGIFWRTGSRHHVAAPTAKAGHGGTNDLVHIDEAFIHQDETLEQGVKPTMITRRSGQLWVVSAAGTEKSIYLKNKIELGRECVRRGLQEGICYFEWSAEDDADPADRKVWEENHPAIGHTIRTKDLEGHFRSMKIEEFARAYLCIWPKKTKPLVIPAEKWEACSDPAKAVPNPVSFAVDVSPNRSTACVAASGRLPDGRIVVEIIRHEGGTSWVVDYVQERLCKNPNSTAWLDPGASAGSLLPEFERKKVPIRLLTNTDVGRSAGFFVDQVNDKKLVHRNELVLNVALAGAVQRKLSDKWAWGRQEGVDITPLVSVTLAAWAVESAPEHKRFKMWDDE